MHDFVTHTVLTQFAQSRVNVPSDTARKRREQVAHLRERLEAYIVANPDYDLVKMRASGSIAKRTAIRSGSDTDVAAYVRASSVGGVEVDEAQLLNWLRDRCQEVYGATKVAEDFVISDHAVGITMRGIGLKIDVAPVLYEDEPEDVGYLVTRVGTRVLTSVTLHLEFLNTRSARAGGEFKELIRLVKAWIARAKLEDRGFRFKSFLAELIVAHLWDCGWNGEPLAVKDYPRAFEQVLGYIVRSGLTEPIVFTDNYAKTKLGWSADPIQAWDPVNPANNVAATYSGDDRRRLVSRAEAALDQISWAAAAPSKGAAIEAWRTLFGPSFPGSIT